MVYGLNVKPVNGYYVECKAMDGDVHAVQVVDQTPDGGIPIDNYHVFTSGRAVDPTFMPTKVHWKDRHHHPVPDFDNGPVLNVSARAKVLIEQYEPGVHQFLPVDFFDIDRKFLESRWFLIVCNRIDSIDREHTQGMMLVRNMMWRTYRDVARRRPEDVPTGVDPLVPPKLVFSLTQIGGAHVWHDKHMSSGEIISDQLANAILAAGMTGLRLSESKMECV